MSHLRLKNQKLTSSRFNPKLLIAFSLIFALVGGYSIYRILALPNPNLPGDLDNNNTVDLTDLSLLLTAFNTTDANADIDASGKVDITDLSIQLTHFGETYTAYSVNQSISNGQTLSGSVTWTATPSDVANTSKVEFYIDGTLKWTENISPYYYNGDNSTLDTTTLSNASHTFMVKAYNTNSTTAQKSVSATVSNTVQQGLSSRVGVAVPNIDTQNVSTTYGNIIKADDGISVVRTDGAMSAVWGSSTGNPNWTYMDRSIQFSKNSGTEMLYVFWSAPQWQHPSCTYSPTYKCPPEPAYYQTWSNEVVQMIDHAAVAGVNLKEVEFWNEPWLPDFWAPSSNPSAYVALLKVFAPTVWAKYPNMKILISADYWEQGNGNPSNTQWFGQVLSADTTYLINDSRIVLTTHNYCQAAAPTTNRGTGWSFDRYILAHDQAVAHGKVNPHVEITEYGWETNENGGISYFGPVSEAAQAQYTVDGAKMAFATGYVDRVFIFMDYPGDAWGYNIHRTNGSIRPVATAVKNYINTGQ